MSRRGRISSGQGGDCALGLTEQQLRFFEAFGFLSIPGLFAEEADSITATFEEVWTDHGGRHGGAPHDHKRRSAFIQFIDHSDFLSGLIDAPRIAGIAGSLLGEDFNYAGGDGNYYVGDTEWHSDGNCQTKYLSAKTQSPPPLWVPARNPPEAIT